MLKPPPVPQIQNEKRLRFFFPSISQGIVVIRLPMVGFWGQIPVLFLHVMFSNRTFLGKKPINNHWWIFFSVKSVKHCYNPSTLRSSPFKKKKWSLPPYHLNGTSAGAASCDLTAMSGHGLGWLIWWPAWFWGVSLCWLCRRNQIKKTYTKVTEINQNINHNMTSALSSFVVEKKMIHQSSSLNHHSWPHVASRLPFRRTTTVGSVGTARQGGHRCRRCGSWRWHQLWEVGMWKYHGG